MQKTHHTVEIAPDGTYWTQNLRGWIQYDPDRLDADGHYKVLRTMSFASLIRKNKNISPLTTRRHIKWVQMDQKGKSEYFEYDYLPDPYHHNDVQPFVDSRFPSKLGYALILSVRNQNLLMIVDPVTQQVLWFVQGVTEYQHDPDYFDGYVYTYDNGTFRDYSRLIRFPLDRDKNPSLDFEVVLDGRKLDWKQPTRGMGELTRIKGHTYYHFLYRDRAAIIMLDENQKQVFVMQNLLNSDPTHGVEIRGVRYISPEDYAQLENGCKRIEE